MDISNLPEDAEVVSLSEAISHPLFSEALRNVVLAMAERPGELSLNDVVAALGMDARAVAERFVADAIGAEILRCRAADAAARQARALN